MCAKFNGKNYHFPGIMEGEEGADHGKFINL